MGSVPEDTNQPWSPSTKASRGDDGKCWALKLNIVRREKKGLQGLSTLHILGTW